MSNQNTNTNGGDEVPVRQLRPVVAGVGHMHVGATDKVLNAREKGKADGCDITWVRSRRAFRVQWVKLDKPDGPPRWIPEARVEEYVEL